MPKNLLPKADLYGLKLGDLEISSLQDSIQDSLLKFSAQLTTRYQELESYLGSGSFSPTPSQSNFYNLENDTNRISTYGVTISLEYTLTSTTTGWWRWKETSQRATLLIHSSPPLGDAAFSYEIPKDNNKLPPEVLREIVDSITSLSLRLSLRPEEEARFVRGVAVITGIPTIAQDYSINKYHALQIEINTELSKNIASAREKLGEIAALVKKFKQVAGNDLHQDLATAAREHIGAEIARVKKDLEDKVRQAEIKIDESFTACDKRLEQKSAAWERETKKKEKAAEAGLKAQHAALAIKLQAYKTKLEALDKKLAGHREQLETDSALIAPTLADLFPDVESQKYYGRRTTYEQEVDGHLRTFYATKLKELLKSNSHFSIKDSLLVIKLLREECYAANRRPAGEDIREIFAGLTAMLSYILKYEISADTLLTFLQDTSKARKGKKPSVEQFIETAVGHDFDMEKCRKELHKKNAATKEELGLK